MRDIGKTSASLAGVAPRARRPRNGEVAVGEVAGLGQASVLLASVLLALVLLALVGCSGDKQAPAAEGPGEAQATAPAKSTQEKPAEAKPTQAEPETLSDTASDASFTMQLKPAGEYTAGELGTLVLDLTPKAPYHVNQDYPMAITVKAPDGVTLPKAELQKADAAEFGEEKARFDVPFTPNAAGEYEIQAHVRFAVCTPETCVPDERTLALAVAVK